MWVLIDLMFELRDQKTGLEFIRVILYYLTKATGRVKLETIQQVVERQGEAGKKIMKTIYDQIKEEGREEGRQSEARENRRRLNDIAQRLLEHHDIVTVSELTGLTIEDVENISKESRAD